MKFKRQPTQSLLHIGCAPFPGVRPVIANRRGIYCCANLTQQKRARNEGINLPFGRILLQEHPFGSPEARCCVTTSLQTIDFLPLRCSVRAANDPKLPALRPSCDAMVCRLARLARPSRSRRAPNSRESAMLLSRHALATTGSCRGTTSCRPGHSNEYPCTYHSQGHERPSSGAVRIDRACLAGRPRYWLC